MNPARHVGCCGAYCKTCKAFLDGHCKGCKLGYEKGGRILDKAKCKIKLCCFRDRKLETCADCPKYESCKTVGDWHAKGYKYERYRKALEYVRKNGYEKFANAAAKWKGAYGKLE